MEAWPCTSRFFVFFVFFYFFKLFFHFFKLLFVTDAAPTASSPKEITEQEAEAGTSSTTAPFGIGGSEASEVDVDT